MKITLNGKSYYKVHCISIKFLTADARKAPFKSLNATLVYADPPTNRGMNEGASSDRLSSFEYQQFTYDWLINSSFHMADNSRLVVCCHYKTRKIIETLVERNFPYKFEQEIIWHYDFGKYERRRFVRSHDNILVWKQGRPPFNWEAVAIESQRLRVGDKRGDPRGRTPGDVWSFPRVPGNSKDRQFLSGEKRSCQPLDLCKRVILSYTNKQQLIYDLFAGSGTMAKACQLEERNYVGIDICSYYVKEIKRRVHHWKTLV